VAGGHLVEVFLVRRDWWGISARGPLLPKCRPKTNQNFRLLRARQNKNLGALGTGGRLIASSAVKLKFRFFKNAGQGEASKRLLEKGMVPANMLVQGCN